MNPKGTSKRQFIGATARPTARLRVFIPEADNDNVQFSPADYHRFESLALDLAGGVSERGRVRGLWQENGRTFADTHREYEIIVPRRRVRGVAATVVEHVRTEFRQLAVFVEITPVRVTGF